jgi:membrane protease YdiL (CAAX protease family)
MNHGGQREPSGLSQAIATAVVCGVLLLLVGGPVQFLNTAFGVWFTEIFAFLGAGWILLRRAGQDPLSFVGANRFDPMKALLGFALGAANFIGVVVPLQYLQQPLIPQWLKDQFDASRLFQNQRPIEIVVIVLGISIAAPFCEEFAFRGIIQKGLASRFTARVALIATAVLFSAYHLDPVGFIARVELGVLFGVLYQRSGTIWPGTMAHAANNLVSASLFLISQKMVAPAQEEPAWQSVAFLSLLGLTLMGALWRAVSRRRSKNAEAIGREEHAMSVDVPTQPGGVAPEAATYIARPSSPASLAGLVYPWLAAAAVSLLLLLALDRRGVALNLYDVAYHLPAIDSDASDAERKAREQLRAARARARRGEIPIDEYLKQRKALRSRFYEAKRSRKPATPPPREPLP